MIKKLHLLFILFSFTNLFSQNIQLSENASVSVFTCGKGEELYTTFGHTAIRIKDLSSNIDVVYNYGMFDFREGNFYLKFVKGNLQYFVAASSYENFIYEYQYFNREVIEQTLNLPLASKQTLFEKLNTSLTSEESHYTYKFIDKNCTTMVCDKINETIGRKIITKVDDKTISYRELLYPYFDNYFWYKLGINIIFGAKTDKKAEQLFLPIELLNSLDKAVVNGKPLVSKKEIIVNGAEINTTFSFFDSIYLIIALLGLIVLINKKFLFKTYLFICGLLGLFLCLVGFYSLHQELLWNYNALLFNPLFLIIPFVKKSWLNKIGVICSILLIVYLIIMLTKPHLFLMLPFIAFNGYILYRFYFNKNLLTSVKKNRT